MLMGVAFFSCSSNTNTATQPEVEVDENTIVLSDGQTTVSWLKDNEGHRMMNRDLFQTAPMENGFCSTQVWAQKEKVYCWRI